MLKTLRRSCEICISTSAMIPSAVLKGIKHCQYDSSGVKLYHRRETIHQYDGTGEKPYHRRETIYTCYLLVLVCLSVIFLNMKPRTGGGVSMSQGSVNKKGRRSSFPIPELVNRLNTSLYIGEGTQQSQPSILQFVTAHKSARCDQLDASNPVNTIVKQNEVQEEVPMVGITPIDQEASPDIPSTETIPAPLLNPSGIVLSDERLSLLDRVTPDMPGALTTTMEGYNALGTYADGFEHIDQLSAMECVLSPFQAMDEVPKQYREVFAKAMETILGRVYENQEEGEELSRALKWWFFIPQALLRKPKRGGRAGMGLVKKRFDCIINDNYGELVKIWMLDRNAIENKSRIPNKPDQDEGFERKTRQAVSLISKGYISKATNRIISHGVANLNDPRSKSALQSKYPARGRSMPLLVTKGHAVDSMMSLREAFLTLREGVAPGTGQLRPEFLVALAEVWNESGSNVWELVDNFALRHIQGNFPPWYFKACMTVETVGMYKTVKQDPSQVRPVGMRNPWIKTIHKEVVTQNKEILTEFLEPQQLGMSKAGGAKLVHCVRMVMEQNPEFICLKLDFKNAFNEVFRARVVEALEEEDTLRHLASHAATLLAPSSGLESRGSLWGEAHEGTTQGDPESGPYFNVAIQKYVKAADEELATSGGFARFGWDDGYLCGPPDEVFTTLDRFSFDVHEHCGLELQRSKTEVLCMEEQLPVNTPDGLVRAGSRIDGLWEPGIICYGVPIGSEKYVTKMLSNKMDELEQQADQIQAVLEDEKQALWAVLRSSLSHKFDYWLTLCYPSQVKSAAERMDALQNRILDNLAGTHIPMEALNNEWAICLPVPDINLQNRSYQHWVIRQPVKMGGLGIRSNVETSLAAYVGGLEQALPHFVGERGICNQLRTVIGEMNGESRWRHLLQSGCRTGQELAKAWTTLKQEAQQCSTYLGTEIQGPLSANVEDAGHGAKDGSTRKKLIAAKEEVRGAVMNESLSRMNNQKRRAVVAWKNRDKLSASWLSCLPGPDGMSSPAFAEALAMTLCMPSPACKDRIGSVVGKRKVDIFGDNIMSAALPGDHWRTRHDKLKMTINSLCTWARLPTTCEVWGLFSHLIPNDVMSRIEGGRKRQGLVPDFRLEMPSTMGGTEYRLAELKAISCCDTWYKPSASNTRATDKRAKRLQMEYQGKAKKVDQDLLGVTAGEKGPLEKRLDEFGNVIGLCFGAWGEASTDVHNLVQTLAEARLKFQGLKEGRPRSKQELGLIVGQVRRRLSLAAVKAQVDCLLSRIHQVGPGNNQLAKKRE